MKRKVIQNVETGLYLFVAPAGGLTPTPVWTASADLAWSSESLTVFMMALFGAQRDGHTVKGVDYANAK